MIELKLISSFPREIIALDEVGLSTLSGPVVIGGLQLKVEDYQSLITLLRSLRRIGVKDSKLLTGEKRQDLLQKIQIDLLPFRQKGVFNWKNIEISYLSWEMGPEIIDKENIYQATRRGMREVFKSLVSSSETSTTLLIDGKSKLIESFRGEEFSIIKGDVKSSLIGLASIIAKEIRDQHMREMHLLYPQYGFDTNVGYPTPFHRKAIEIFGPCPIHRKSFSKVKEFLKSKNGL